MKKISLSVAAAAVLAITAVSTGFAAELPSYEKAGLPISPVQVQVLGAANVREQAPTATSAVSSHQFSVLAPRSQITTTAATDRIQTIGRAAR